MKKFFLIIMLIPLLILSSVPGFQASAAAVKINVYNWGEYISDGADGSVNINKAFTKATGIQVNYTTFSSNEELYAKMLGGSTDYDVIIPSDYMIARLAEEDMLEKLDFSNIPNFELIDEEFRTDVEYDPRGEYSVPYMWGTVGILYNTGKVSDTVNSWEILWNEKYKNDILMFDNPRDAFGVAQKLLGQSFNTTKEADWKAAAEKLKEQKPLVQAYAMDQILDKMGNNEAALATYYAGDALILKSDNDKIDFVVPKEGSNVFVDAFCIPKGCRNKSAAEAYINFMCETQAAYANAEYIGYSSPQTEAAEMHYEYLIEEFGEEGAKIAYPDELENCETFTNLPIETSLLLDELWISVKAGSGDSTLMLVLVILGFFLVWVGVAIYKKWQRKRRSF